MTRTRSILLGGLVSAALASCATHPESDGGSFDGGSSGDPRIVLTAMDPATGISGTFLDATFTLGVGATVDDRTASYAGTADGSSASMTTNDATRVTTFEVGNIRWQDPATLSPGDRTALEAFTHTAAGRALVATAPFLYWKNSSTEYMPYRVAAIQLYQGLAPFYAPADKLLTQPEGTLLPGCPEPNPCQVRTNDALFGCAYADGHKDDVTLLMKGLPTECQVVGDGVARSHETNNCYGACGASCAPIAVLGSATCPPGSWNCVPQGGCALIELRCTAAGIVWQVNPPSDLTDGTSAPTACYVQPPTPFYPRDVRRDAAACTTPESYPAGSYWLCSTKPACYQHDECNRHDRFTTANRNYALCQALGIVGAGASAAWGRPQGGFDYKWFTQEGLPLGVGSAASPAPPVMVCGWENRCAGGSCAPQGTFTTPAAPLAPLAPLEADHQVCLVHQCKHDGHEEHCSCTTSADCHPSGASEDPPEPRCDPQTRRCGPCLTCTPGGLTPPFCNDDDGCGHHLGCEPHACPGSTCVPNGDGTFHVDLTGTSC